MPQNFPCSESVSCDCAGFGVSAELADCQGPTGEQGPAGEDGTPGITTFFGADNDPNGIVLPNSAGDFYKADPALGGDGSLWVSRDGTVSGWI